MMDRSYRIMAAPEGWAVEITEPGAEPRLVGDFISQQEAQGWIQEDRGCVRIESAA